MLQSRNQYEPYFLPAPCNDFKYTHTKISKRKFKTVITEYLEMNENGNTLSGQS